jgi:hypothetical protein
MLCYVTPSHGRCGCAELPSESISRDRHSGEHCSKATSTLRQFREAVGTPAFAAHSVMYEEQAARIVLVLHRE